MQNSNIPVCKRPGLLQVFYLLWKIDRALADVYHQIQMYSLWADSSYMVTTNLPSASVKISVLRMLILIT